MTGLQGGGVLPDAPHQQARFGFPFSLRPFLRPSLFHFLLVLTKFAVTFLLDGLTIKALHFWGKRISTP